jgi:hypothetical protein
MGSGDPTASGIDFQSQATVVPKACTVTRLYVAASVNSEVSVGFHIWRSAGGTGAPTDTGVFVAAGAGSENRMTTDLSLAAGDTVAYQVTPGAYNKRLVGSGAILCGDPPPEK